MYLAQNEVTKQPRSYFRSRSVMSPQGEYRKRTVDWANWLAHQAVVDNPRLQKKMQGQPFMTSDSFATPMRIQQVNHSTEDAPPE
jgi:hypothetical protein